MWLALVLLFLFLPLPVRAQTVSELSRLAIQAGTVYRTAHTQYVQAKNAHIQQNTAATRQVAIEKTVSVLDKRNLWQVAYLRFLRQTLAEVTNIANYPQTVTYLDLESEVNVLATLTYNSGELDSFTKINEAAKNWESRLVKSDRQVAAAQLQAASARLAALQNELTGQLTILEEKIGTPSATVKSTLELIKSKLQTSVSTREKVDNQINARRDSFSYTGFRQELTNAQADLAESSRLLIEVSFQIQ